MKIVCPYCKNKIPYVIEVKNSELPDYKKVKKEVKK
jgi:hypothetical protein